MYTVSELCTTVQKSIKASALQHCMPQAWQQEIQHAFSNQQILPQPTKSIETTYKNSAWLIQI